MISLVHSLMALPVIGPLLRPTYVFLKRVRVRVLVRVNSRNDRRRYLQAASGGNAVLDREMLGSLVTMDYHRIEKGLALPEPRPGFGRDVARRLVELSRSYERRFGVGIPTECARGALAEYLERGHAAHAGIEAEVQAYLADGPPPSATRSMSRDAIQRAASVDFDAFARARHSVRNFTGAPVSPEAIRAAVRTAQWTPSVCNRQAARVHAVFGRDAMKRALSYQNGNAGFGHLAGALLIVSADLRCFTGSGERNQAFVDGGLFAMSLNYALHAQGLGTCMWNWSVNSDVDRAMRAAMNIADTEVVITMLGVGHMPERFLVAKSARRPLDEVLREIDADKASAALDTAEREAPAA